MVVVSSTLRIVAGCCRLLAPIFRHFLSVPFRFVPVKQSVEQNRGCSTMVYAYSLLSPLGCCTLPRSVFAAVMSLIVIARRPDSTSSSPRSPRHQHPPPPPPPVFSRHNTLFALRPSIGCFPLLYLELGMPVRICPGRQLTHSTLRQVGERQYRSFISTFCLPQTH
jgi:hypothetical protein